VRARRAPDDPIDALYAAPLDEFVETRNALVKQLREANEPDAVRRPSCRRRSLELLG